MKGVLEDNEMRELDSLNTLPTNPLSKPGIEHAGNSNESVKFVEKTDKSSGLDDETKTSQDSLVDEVKKSLDKLNSFIPVTATNLVFEFDEKGDPPFIRVLDKDNDEVIREIPSKEFRKVAKALEELADKLSGKGAIFDKTA
jgi:flagellar protein FlaG